MARRASTRRRPPLGQHFLRDTRARERILGLLQPRAEDCWLEIGPGHGEMTLPLAAVSRTLTAVERDPGLATSLRDRLSALAGARVVQRDILKFPLAEALRGTPSRRLRIYGNLPYYITSPILRYLFAASGLIEDIHVMVQREVAERLVAAPDGRDYGYLSVLTQFFTAPEILLAIPRSAFQPPPQVESALVRLLPPGLSPTLKIKQPEAFLRFVGLCFRQKRKTLVNNLRATHAAGRVEEELRAGGLPSKARAEELSLQTFARLYTSLSGQHAPVESRETL